MSHDDIFVLMAYLRTSNVALTCTGYSGCQKTKTAMSKARGAMPSSGRWSASSATCNRAARSAEVSGHLSRALHLAPHANGRVAVFDVLQARATIATACNRCVRQ
ncbi:MAG: hypothetical protein JWO59_2021 [Chloroflexi bacterium]|nr:hypothetical protein [Chloroflexota bacterium]